MKNLKNATKLLLKAHLFPAKDCPHTYNEGHRLQILRNSFILKLMSIINWIKSNKLIVLLIIIIAFLLFKKNDGITPLPLPIIDNYRTSAPSIGMVAPEMSLPKTTQNFSDTTDRIVTKTSDLSLLVKDVRSIGDQIIAYSKNSGGFMVYASYNRPTESPFATITIRVPTEKLDDALNYIRSLSIKVTSENLVGTDVTEEYVDIEASLATLNKTKEKFEEILEKAITVTDILTVQRELISLQQQIDSYVGQKKSIENNAKLTIITVYLSTDELALPYTPDKAFRPDVVFKLAVRSLLNTLRSGAEKAIWIGVYSIVWAPILLGFIAYKKSRRKQQSSLQSTK